MSRTILRRTLALQLLLAVSLVPWGRQILDLRADLSTAGAIESEHSIDNPNFHYPALCVLWLKTPWSPPAPSPAPIAVNPRAVAVAIAEGVESVSGVVVLHSARSPPQTIQTQS